MFGFFIIRKLFDISCISDYVQSISKPLSVVLAECGHFVVTWSVQEYSCGHLVYAGIFLHSPGLLSGHIGINKTKHRNRGGIFTWSHWYQQNEAQKQRRNFYIK